MENSNNVEKCCDDGYLPHHALDSRKCPGAWGSVGYTHKICLWYDGGCCKTAAQTSCGTET